MYLFIKFLSMHVKSALQYKTAFILLIFGRGIMSLGMLFSINFLFERFNKVEGFSYNEILICFGVVLTAFSIAECFFRGLDSFPSIIGNGEFDRILLRPRNEIFLAVTSKFEFTNIGRIAIGVGTLIYACMQAEFEWTAAKFILLCLMVFSGVIIFASLFLIYAALCFFTLDGLEFMNIFTDGGREFGRYPFVIYGKNILIFLTFAVPLALFQYYPLLFLIGHSDNVMLCFLPIAGMLFTIPSYFLWKFGIKKYKSTGS